MSTHICVLLRAYTYTYRCVYIYIYTYCIDTHIRIHACMYVCMYVCMHAWSLSSLPADWNAVCWPAPHKLELNSSFSAKVQQLQQTQAGASLLFESPSLLRLFKGVAICDIVSTYMHMYITVQVV